MAGQSDTPNSGLVLFMLIGYEFDIFLVVIAAAGVANPILLDHDVAEAYVSQHVGPIRATVKSP